MLISSSKKVIRCHWAFLPPSRKKTKQLLKTNWLSFQSFFAQNILPIYQQHEKDFDFYGFHGRRHLTRSVIFAEAMTRLYYKKGLKPDFYGIRLAVSFHDSGRKGNGRDIWEKESSQNCYDFLISDGNTPEYSQAIADSILDKKSDIQNLHNQIIYDADVLEIMRLFTDNIDGWQKFRPKELFFLSERDLAFPNLSPTDLEYRSTFVQEVWSLIRESEKWTLPMKNEDYLPTYLAYIFGKSQQFPLLYSLLKKTTF